MYPLKRVGIDFHVVDGIFQGSRTFVLELFSEVIKISPDIHFILFLDKTELLKSFSPIFNAPNVELVHMPSASPITRLCWQLPRLQIRYKLDILHTQYILPIPSLSPGIVTIHDILFESHPQYFSPIFRLRSAVLIRLSAWRAKHIFTVSEYSKKEIISRYGIQEEKISTTYNGVNLKKYFPGIIGKDVIESRGLLSKGYLLSVGRLEPRKNYVTLLRAYKKTENPKLPLVIIGQQHFGYEDVFNVIRDLGIEQHVHILNDIKDEELPAFYRHAKLFIYPTWAEGFGIPLLESIASGVPVITSNTTSIPEVVGDAAILVEPNDIYSLAEEINHLLTDEKLYGDLQRYGLKQVYKYQWKSSAKHVRNIYLSHIMSLGQ